MAQRGLREPLLSNDEIDERARPIPNRKFISDSGVPPQSESGVHTPPQTRARMGHAALLGSSAGNATERISPQPLFPPITVSGSLESRSRERSISGSGGTPKIIPPGLASPGHPSHSEPANSVPLGNVACGRLPQVEPEATVHSLKPLPVRKGTAVPSGEVVGVGTAPTRKAPHSILSRLAIPPLATQLVFRRNLSIAIWALTSLFFLLPVALTLYIRFGTDSNVPPSTDHHKNRDGPFYPTALRWWIGVYGAAYMAYFLVVGIWSVRRVSFFPFKVRPMLLVFASNVWGFCILAWLWARYVLSDMASYDTADGLFPPCMLSQFVVGVAQIGLILPYILRAFQLARIFSEEFGTAGGPRPRDRDDPARLSASSSRGGTLLNGQFVPPSPSLNSQMSDETNSVINARSNETTPRLAPMPLPSDTEPCHACLQPHCARYGPQSCCNPFATPTWQRPR